MTADPLPRTVQLFPSGELGIVWSDDREDFLPARTLRLACPCAECVDEMTGRKILSDETVGPDLGISSWREIGSYAIGLTFSDGHATGIFTFERLRDLGSATA